jgi:hypothetical protein
LRFFGRCLVWHSPQHGSQPFPGQRRLGGFGHSLLFHARDLLRRLIGNAFADGAGNTLLADTPELTRGSGLPVCGHVEHDLAGEKAR